MKYYEYLYQLAEELKAKMQDDMTREERQAILNACTQLKVLKERQEWQKKLCKRA